MPLLDMHAQSSTLDENGLLGSSTYQRLRDRILSGELRPGSSLSVPRLATELGVSRSPVREAVQQLIYEGLAVHVPFAGATVTRLDADELRAVFRVREVLDGLAAHDATALITNGELGALRDLVDEQRRRLDGPADETADVAIDLRFHRLIHAAARNDPLGKASARLEAMAHLFRSSMWLVEGHRRLAVAEHEAILEALEAGDAVGARRAAEAHVAGLAVRMTRS